MERHLGRKLTKDEIVHHKDGDKTNNDIKNLELMLRGKHTNFHRKKTEMVEISCAFCNKKIVMRKKRYENRKKHGQKSFLCSRLCTHKHNQPNKGTSKYKQIIEEGLSNDWSGYKISKEYNLNRQTVYNYLRNREPPVT